MTMNEWHKLLVKPTDSVIETMRIIDETAEQIAIVVNDQNRLVGTVTDGDIRRGILAGFSLDSEVQQIMNKQPTFISTYDSFYKIISLFQRKKLRHLPVVDQTMCVVDVKYVEDFFHTKKKDNWIVIMAGGLGTRLQPLTNEVPKPMLTVGSKPILETILENFIEQGFHKFFFAVNYKKELIVDYFGDGSRWGITIQYINEEKKLGTAGALSLFREKPIQPFIVMNGDILTKVNFNKLLQFHEETESTATMCVRKHYYQVPYGVVKTDGHILQLVEEKPLQTYFVNAGIYVISPEALQQIPLEQFYDMTTLFSDLIRCEFVASVFPIQEYWMDIGRIGDYEKANIEFEETFG